MSVIAQGGARTDLHPDVKTAAAHLRRMYEIGVTRFGCPRACLGGRAEGAYAAGLEGVRNNVLPASKTMARTVADARKDLQASLRLSKTGYLELWRLHNITIRNAGQKVLPPGSALKVLEAAKKEGKCASSASPGSSIWKPASPA